MKNIFLILASICVISLSSCFHDKSEDPQPQTVQAPIKTKTMGDEYFGKYQSTKAASYLLTINSDSLSFDVNSTVHYAYPGSWLTDSTFQYIQPGTNSQAGILWTMTDFTNDTLTVVQSDISGHTSPSTTKYALIK